MAKLPQLAAVMPLFVVVAVFFTLSAHAQSYNTVTGPFPFCPPCEKNVTQYTVQLADPSVTPPDHICWQIILREFCPDPTNTCCTFFISKVEIWIKDSCPTSGYTGLKGVPGNFTATKNPESALMSPYNPFTPGSKVIRIQGINITAGDAPGTLFCIKPPATGCLNVFDLCYQPTPDWQPGNCLISLFDPYPPYGHTCCPVVQTPPDEGGDALPPPPPVEPPPWSGCNCNKSRDGTPFHFKNDVAVLPGEAPNTQKYCFMSDFRPVPQTYYKERCPKVRFVHKIEFHALEALRSKLVGATYRLIVPGVTTDPVAIPSNKIAWRDPNTGPNVLKLLDVNFPRATWQEGVEICLELADVPLDEFCITTFTDPITGITSTYPIQCLYAIFDENKVCCPIDFLGYGQDI